MGTKLSLSQFEEINSNLIVDGGGNTNKKCPFCGSDVVVEEIGNCYIIKCSKNACFSVDGRGL